MVLEGSVGIWPRKDPVPVTDAPEPVAAATVSLGRLIDQMKSIPVPGPASEQAIDMLGGDQGALPATEEPDLPEPFPVDWPGWADKTDEGWTRRALWGAYNNNVAIIMEKGDDNDLDDDWAIEADAALDHMKDVAMKVKVKMREVVARSLPTPEAMAASPAAAG